MSAVAGSALIRSHTSKPLMPGIRTSSSTRSGGEAAMCASAASPSNSASTRRPSRASMRARNATMSGSSSTTRTRNAVCEAASREAAARSLIRDFDPGEEVGVACDALFEGRAVAAAGAVLDLLADGRDALEAVGVSHPLHPVAELPQLLEIGRGKRHPQGIDFLVAVLEEHGDQVFEVFGDDDFVAVFLHVLRIIGGPCGLPRHALSTVSGNPGMPWRAGRGAHCNRTGAGQ